MNHLELILRDQATQTRNALTRFLSHRPGSIALAGSIAMAAQLSASVLVAPRQAFGDIDLVTSSLDDLPSTLASEFLCPHVHAAVRPGRTLAQFVHPEDAVRIDVFRVIGEALSRATEFRFGTERILVLSAEDQAARAASLCMKIKRGGTVAAKHARDLQQLSRALRSDLIDTVWQEYRHESDPLEFADAVAKIEVVSRANAERLTVPEYCRDQHSVCGDCAASGAFRPADPSRVFAVLGYV